MVCNLVIFSYRPNNSNSNNTEFNHIIERIKELQQNINRLNITVQKTDTKLTDFKAKLKLEKKTIDERHADTETKFGELEKNKDNLDSNLTSVSRTYENIWNTGKNDCMIISNFVNVTIFIITFWIIQINMFLCAVKISLFVYLFNE